MSSFSIVQVGLGLWGRSWAELVASGRGLRLAAVVDADVAARSWGESTLGVPAFRSLGPALRAVESDAVLLVSPPSTHRRLAEQSLAAGRHVLVEKPFALTLTDAAAVASAARGARLHAMVSQNYRFRRQSRALQRLVADGTLGPLLGVRIACRRDLRSAWISPRDWRGRMTHPYLFDMAVHHVDLLRAITGREVVEVDARAWRVPDGPFRHEPTVEALFAVDGGTPVAYEGTWAATSRETSWNGDWELVGERGRATWTGGAADALRGVVQLERYGANGAARVELPRLAALDRLATVYELRRAAETGEPPECSAEDNLRTLATLFAVARSIEERRPVRVAELHPTGGGG
jgi:predicted dehydrogenase